MKSFQAMTILSVLLLPLHFASAAFDPIEYRAPNPPDLKGALAVNSVLQSTKLIGLHEIRGPEGLAIDSEGNLYTGTHDGSILKIDQNHKITTLGNTGGRALGISLSLDGRLVIADMLRGLLVMDQNGNVETLSTEADGRRFGILDDVKVARDGKIYFSEATYKYSVDNYQLDALEGRPNGRLLVYDPNTRQTSVLIKELYFANGIALSKNEDFILVCESSRYRITRYWLKGEKQGSTDTFTDNMPGFPDNISRSPDGGLWVAMVAPRNGLLDWLHKYPAIKKLVAKMPKSVWAKQKKYGLVLKISETGENLKSLHDPTAIVIFGITSVEQYRNSLYFGTYEGGGVGELKIADF
ncbi:MAG: hypothetical protein A4S09_14355 [Proteobacteria bacterium SG_bin7]|nr:MAG: hypothetical protein A4S09_14355 [Proteobacteria bacterium SG_bin7]